MQYKWIVSSKSQKKFNIKGNHHPIIHTLLSSIGVTTDNQAKEFLAKRDANNNEFNSNRAFKLLKQDEEIGRVNEKWWSNLKQLENR